MIDLMRVKKIYTSKKIKFFWPLFIILTLTFILLISLKDYAMHESKVPRPLKNLGGTCYMNAALQALYQVVPLTKFVLKYGNEYYEPNTIANAYIKLLNDIISDKEIPLEVTKEFCKPVFEEFFYEFDFDRAKGQHQDAGEFLRQLIYHLADKDMKKNKLTYDADKNVISPVTSLFYSKIESKITYDYKGNQYTSTKSEAYSTIELPIIKPIKGKEKLSFEELKNLFELNPSFQYVTLRDCLNAYFSSENLSGDDAIIHEDFDENRNLIGKVKVDAIKKLTPKMFAPYLIFKFNRFSTIREKETFRSIKLEHLISFPYEGLELTNYFSKDVAPFMKDSYNLIAIVQHSGKLDYGHYTAYVKHGNQWYYCDDTTIVLIEEEAIKKIAADGVDGSFTPYILIYKSQKDIDIDGSVKLIKTILEANEKKEIFNKNSLKDLSLSLDFLSKRHKS